jgi:hypothetical protein
MVRRKWARRAMLAGCVGVLVSAATIAFGQAAPQASPDAVDAAALRFRTVVVDTSRLEALGSASTAALVKRSLGAEARTIFADRLAPGDARAPSLLIRIDSISLASYAGDYPAFSGMGNTDYLEGAGIVSSGGHVISTTPVLSALDASYSGAWYQPDIDERRVVSLSHHFAYWLRRQMGL